jgi:CheY-specific phosphatase CheX
VRTDQLLDALQEQFCAVLEQAAFLCAEPQAGPVAADRAVTARLEFHGELVGAVAIVVDGAVARELTANLLGADDGAPLAEALVADAVGEVLNMTCNHFLSTVTGAERAFGLRGPFVSSDAGEAARDLARASGTRRLAVQERPVVLALTLGGAAP